MAAPPPLPAAAPPSFAAPAASYPTATYPTATYPTATYPTASYPTPSFAPPPATAPPAGAYAGPALGEQPQAAGPALPASVASTGGDLRATRASVEAGLREYVHLLGRRYRTDEVGMEERLRKQADAVSADLRSLRRDVSAIVQAAESRRWRRWMAGAALASFVPAVRALFRRPADELDAANDTEYAFRKSRSLLARIKASLPGRGALAAVAAFVFAVLYVFQNEVSLRVARTVAKRLRRLAAKLESGEGDVDEADLKLLRGWRWRILLWNP